MHWKIAAHKAGLNAKNHEQMEQSWLSSNGASEVVLQKLLSVVQGCRLHTLISFGGEMAERSV